MAPLGEKYEWKAHDPRTRVALTRCGEFVQWSYQEGYRDSLADDLLYVLKRVQELETAEDA